MNGADSLPLPPESNLYAVAYQPLRRGKEDLIDVWRAPMALEQPLPTLPLGLRVDLVIPVDFEENYTETRLHKRLIGP
jgi:hypothetical protein